MMYYLILVILLVSSYSVASRVNFAQYYLPISNFRIGINHEVINNINALVKWWCFKIICWCWNRSGFVAKWVNSIIDTTCSLPSRFPGVKWNFVYVIVMSLARFVTMFWDRCVKKLKSHHRC